MGAANPPRKQCVMRENAEAAPTYRCKWRERPRWESSHWRKMPQTVGLDVRDMQERRDPKFEVRSSKF